MAVNARVIRSSRTEVPAVQLPLRRFSLESPQAHSTSATDSAGAIHPIPAFIAAAPIHLLRDERSDSDDFTGKFLSLAPRRPIVRRAGGSSQCGQGRLPRLCWETAKRDGSGGRLKAWEFFPQSENSWLRQLEVELFGSKHFN